MKIEQKEKIWSVLCKYEQTLDSLCDSLSNILQEKEEKNDYINVFRNYRKMNIEDTKIVDMVLGEKIAISVN
jgi:hypothetical protein